MMPTAIEEIASVTDDVKRARLQMLSDIVNELDDIASKHRGIQPPRGRKGAEGLMDGIQAAIADEFIKGVITAAELVVRKFRAEADAVPEPAPAPAGEPNGETRRDQVEQLPEL